MAKDKNTILIYKDWISMFENLDDDEAGKLIKHLFRYVNDMQPEAPDKLTLVAFEPMKQQLKRDLKSWEEKIPKLALSGSNGGKKSGETRRKKAEERSKTKQNEAKIEIRSELQKNEANEGEKEKVKEKDKDILSKECASDFNFDFVEHAFKIPFMDWVEYRAVKKPFTMQVSVEAAYKELKELSGGSPLEAIKIVQHSKSQEFSSLVKKRELFVSKYTPVPPGEIKATVAKGVPNT
jgi:hypothetical protein